MSFDPLHHSLSANIACFDFEALNAIVAEQGDEKLVQVFLHGVDSGMLLPIRHAILSIAIAQYYSDTALSKLIKAVEIPIDVPGHVNASELPSGFHRSMGLPCNDKGYRWMDKLHLDRTLLSLLRVELEGKFRRKKFIKHARGTDCPETFYGALCLSAPGVTLDEWLDPLVDSDDRSQTRQLLMERLPYVIRQPEHLRYVKVSDIVDRARLLSPHNTDRFLFWDGIFEQMHPDFRVSKVAPLFLNYLLGEGAEKDKSGCSAILKGCHWLVHTDNRVPALKTFLASLNTSLLQDIQDDPVFQTMFAWRHQQSIEHNPTEIPSRAKDWLSRLKEGGASLVEQIMDSVAQSPVDWHDDQIWPLIQGLADRLPSEACLDAQKVAAYKDHLTQASTKTVDFATGSPAASRPFYRWNRHDIENHLIGMEAFCKQRP